MPKRLSVLILCCLFATAGCKDDSPKREPRPENPEAPPASKVEPASAGETAQPTAKSDPPAGAPAPTLEPQQVLPLEADFLTRARAVTAAICQCADVACATEQYKAATALQPPPEVREQATAIAKEAQACLSTLAKAAAKDPKLLGAVTSATGELLAAAAAEACTCATVECAGTAARKLRAINLTPADMPAAQAAGARIQECMQALLPTNPGAGGPTVSNPDFVKLLDGAVERLCKCPDMECAKMLLPVLRKLKPSPADAMKAAAAGMRMQTCLKRLAKTLPPQPPPGAKTP
jgi:hypothetical protein